MRFLTWSLPVSLCAAAAISSQNQNACIEPNKRVEWRNLKPEDQRSYIDAVLCLKTRPSEIGLNTSRYDDFPYVHTHLDMTIHFVAMFLPWHRLFVQVYEASLHDCGYTGPMPYWDWTLDSNDMTKSTIWDAETGFGGNGDPAVDPWTESSARKCLVDGPLVNLRPSYTMTGYEEHCLARNWNNGTAFPGDMFASHYTKEAVDSIATLTTYDDFRIQLEGGPHGAIHSAVGGDMSPATSPNDPIFFLHHAQIDRLWTLWQQKDPEARTMAFGGRRIQEDDSPEATLEDIMPYLGLIPDTKVSEVMTTPSSLFCYIY